MNFERNIVDKCIRNVHKIKSIEPIDVEIDDFFNINIDANINIEDHDQDNLIFYNEIEDVIFNKCSEKEAYIVWLLSQGKSFNEISKIFGITYVRTRAIYNEVLDKICIN